MENYSLSDYLIQGWFGLVWEAVPLKKYWVLTIWWSEIAWDEADEIYMYYSRFDLKRAWACLRWSWWDILLTIWSEEGLSMFEMELMRSCLLRNLSSTSIPSTHVLPLHQRAYTFSDSFISVPDVASFDVPSSPANITSQCFEPHSS